MSVAVLNYAVTTGEPPEPRRCWTPKGVTFGSDTPIDTPSFEIARVAGSRRVDRRRHGKSELPAMRASAKKAVLRRAEKRHCASMTESAQDPRKAKAGATIIPVTPFQQNCLLLWCEATRSAVVVDPGGDVPTILEAIRQAGVAVEKIWLTHGHVDHVGGAAELRDALKVPIEGPHIADKFLLDNTEESGRKFGMPEARDFTPDRWLDGGDKVHVGTLSFELLHCPGHSPGSLVFFNREMRFADVGDVLFQGSVGRTDLPGGNHATLIESIVGKLLPLGDDVSFVCGHGPGSTIGQERRANPYINGAG
jgi:hydroxyacylglutathione hydrolase